MKDNKKLYISASVGAVLMVLLRFLDQATILSVILVVGGMSALLYSVCHISTKGQFLTVAGIVTVTFMIRFYGYTGEMVEDLLLGLAVGLIMFALMAVELLLKKYRNKFYFTLIFPTTYLFFLYFTEWTKISMPFRLDTYISCLPVLCQIVSVLGIYFLDFLLGWTASVLVFLLDNRTSRQSRILAIVYGALFCAVLIFGVVHLNIREGMENAKQDTVRVGCVTGRYYGTVGEGYSNIPPEEILASFRKVTKEAAEKDTEILIFSEEAYALPDDFEEPLVNEAKQAARDYGMHIILALDVEDTDGSEEGKELNKLLWISNEGEVLYEYLKHCLVPFVEASEFVRGEENIAPFEVEVHGKTITVATAICYDADFDFFMSHMGKKADLLLLPTWDWEIIAEEHFGVARLRAIANETTLVRSVYDGWNAVINSAGKVLSRANTNDIGYETVWVYDVPIS